jgi:hypothetical protein
MSTSFKLGPHLNEDFLSAVVVLGGKPFDELDRDDLMAVLYQFYINMECSEEAREEAFKENDALRLEGCELRGEMATLLGGLRWDASPKTAQTPPPSPSQYAQNAAALSGETVEQNKASAEALLALHRVHRGRLLPAALSAPAVDEGTLKTLQALDQAYGDEDYGGAN